MSRSSWFHLMSAVSWVPITIIIFLLGLQGAIVIVFLLSIYNNLKTDWGAFHASRATDKRKGKEE